MEPEYWHDKWNSTQIGFHNAEPHPLLLKHIDVLKLAEQSRLFLPLCGKTVDIAWLLSKGYRVVGAELSEIAVQQLFVELGMTPDVKEDGAIVRYRASNVDIFVGDIFDLVPGQLGQVDAVYDRAALVALPQATRRRYAGHVAQLTRLAPQLLISLEYDQSQLNGPPFSISDAECNRCYGDFFAESKIDTVSVAGGLKGRCPAHENVWWLQPF